MLPILLNRTLRAGLAGRGEAHARRAALLKDADVTPMAVAPEAADAALAGLELLFIAGLEEGEARLLASRARAMGILVNVEDRPSLCDFHVPAIVRRGDLVITASTGGRAPALARLLREWLARRFGPEWTGRLDDLGGTRARLRGEGVAPSEISRRLADLVAERGWL